MYVLDIQITSLLQRKEPQLQDPIKNDLIRSSLHAILTINSNCSPYITMEKMYLQLKRTL